MKTTGAATAASLPFEKKVESRSERAKEPREKRPTYATRSPKLAWTMNRRSMSVSEMVISVASKRPSRHQLVTKLDSRSPIIRIVCFSRSSFSSTIALVNCATGKRKHIVSTSPSKKPIAR